MHDEYMKRQMKEQRMISSFSMIQDHAHALGNRMDTLLKS